MFCFLTNSCTLEYTATLKKCKQGLLLLLSKEIRIAKFVILWTSETAFRNGELSGGDSAVSDLPAGALYG